MFDLIIKNGLIYDGKGSKPYKADLAISNEKIVGIGDIQGDAKEIINALLSNQDDENLEFKISNNDSASSSIFDFGKKSLEQNLKMISKINLKSQKFDTIVKKNFIELNNYNFWVIDLQGSELLALNGAIDSIKKCKSILIEVSKSDYYSNGAKWDELKNFQFYWI